MATWEDGPEYAPLERPQYFADAPLPPLEQAPPVARPADGLPSARPRFAEPSAPVAALATLVPELPDERDPARPFDTITTTLTSESAWTATGPSASSRSFVATQPFAASQPFGASQPLGAAETAPGTPATDAPWPVLDQPGPASAQVPGPHDPYAFPSPGTPAWFAPPPTAYGEQPRPGRIDARQVVEAATPGLCICLAIGGLVYPLAPVMLVLAVFLSTRVRVAQRAVRIAFRIAAGVVGFFAVVGLFRSVLDGDPWWHFLSLWSLLICWTMLGVLLLVVGQALVRPKPPTPNPWG